MPLGTLQQTITTGANFIPELWMNKIIAATEANLVFRKLMWDWSDGVSGKGDTIHVPNVSNLSTNSKSANTQVTLNAPTESKTDLSVNSHEECSFMIEDILKVQSSYNLMQHYTGKAGYAISKKLDTDGNALVSSLSQVLGSAGTDIGDTQIRDGIEFLDLADAPGDDRHLVIYPDQKNALFGIEKYFRADYRGEGQSSILVKGKFGEIYGIPVYVSTNVGTSGSPAARLNCLFHREAFASAIQMGPRSQGAYILEYLGNLVVNDVLYGQTESRDSFAAWLKS